MNLLELERNNRTMTLAGAGWLAFSCLIALLVPLDVLSGFPIVSDLVQIVSQGIPVVARAAPLSRYPEVFSFFFFVQVLILPVQILHFLAIRHRAFHFCYGWRRPWLGLSLSTLWIATIVYALYLSEGPHDEVFSELSSRRSLARIGQSRGALGFWGGLLTMFVSWGIVIWWAFFEDWRERWRLARAASRIGTGNQHGVSVKPTFSDNLDKIRVSLMLSFLLSVVCLALASGWDLGSAAPALLVVAGISWLVVALMLPIAWLLAGELRSGHGVVRRTEEPGRYWLSYSVGIALILAVSALFIGAVGLRLARIYGAV